MMNARELLARSMAAPAILDDIADGDDLRESGLNSGEMVLVVMHLEEEIRRALDDEEITSVTTIAAIDDLLRTAGPADATTGSGG
ncbi:phosphopantetheine-binding protein [Kitasatospora sp. NPDC059463]|uniref:phosphopantetheine-binding protein n=1 Tax=unclassified Kitasatospora TaxID=2633591 RepID=UPI0036A7C189